MEIKTFRRTTTSSVGRSGKIGFLCSSKKTKNYIYKVCVHSPTLLLYALWCTMRTTDHNITMHPTDELTANGKRKLGIFCKCFVHHLLVCFSSLHSYILSRHSRIDQNSLLCLLGFISRSFLNLLLFLEVIFFALSAPFPHCISYPGVIPILQSMQTFHACLLQDNAVHKRERESQTPARQ